LDLNASFQSAALAVERSARAVELAVEHGWADEPVVAVPTRSTAWGGSGRWATPWLNGHYAGLQSWDTACRPGWTCWWTGAPD